MRRKAVTQGKIDYTVSELAELERELVQAITERITSEKVKEASIRMVHDRLSTMRKYVAAQNYLASCGDIHLES